VLKKALIKSADECLNINSENINLRIFSPGAALIFALETKTVDDRQVTHRSFYRCLSSAGFKPPPSSAEKYSKAAPVRR